MKPGLPLHGSQPGGGAQDKPVPLDHPLCRSILTLLSEDRVRLTPRDLYFEVRRITPGVSRRELRQAVNTLVDSGRLTYTHHFSASHLELSFKQPIQVSPRITLSPPGHQHRVPPGQVLVKLGDGAVFGAGDHPTTRLVLQGLDHVLNTSCLGGIGERVRVLDVGTGSGVLALAALKLGAGFATGIDIDPLACDAARKNALINEMQHRFEIRTRLPNQNHSGAFHMILANLRPPTLKQLLPRLARLSAGGAAWVLSGFRLPEQKSLMSSLEHLGGRQLWASTGGNWAAFSVFFPEAPVRPLARR